MDIIFNCPKCEQELAVDKSGAGSEITCPSCSEKIVIPQSASPASSGTVPVRAASQPHSAMSSSAAAKVEMHLKVPDHSQPSASLIGKPSVPMEVAAKAVFVMVGAEPNTDWLAGSVMTDAKGFVCTGPVAGAATPHGTSRPGVFAVGDVRAGSVKRVASSVGEGSVVISEVWRYLNPAV